MQEKYAQKKQYFMNEEVTIVQTFMEGIPDVQNRWIPIKHFFLCLNRLDKYRNWDNYVDFPTDDLMLEEPSSINKEKRREALNFQSKNYNKFWSNLVKWHRNWWT